MKTDGEEGLVSSGVGKCPFHHLLSEAFVNDPYPALAEARKEAAAHYLEDLNLWLVPRYADVQRIFRDPSTFKNSNVQKPLFPFSEEAVKVLQEKKFDPGPSLSGSDGDLHKRLRAKAAQALEFTPRNVTQLTEFLSATARNLISQLPGGEQSFDIVAQLLSKFPPKVIYTLIGFPEEDHEKLQMWCMDRLQMFWGKSTVQDQLNAAEGLSSYWNYCFEFVRDCLATEREDITHRLLALHRADPEQLSQKEVAGIIFGLVFAGQETTVNSLSSMLKLLLEDRSRWEAVRADRSLVDKAFLETLRLEPPIAAWRRYATTDTTVGDVKIPQGANILMHLGSTGHDEDKFGTDSESFSLTRKDSEQHLAFGNGLHFCLGAPLAKLEAKVMLNTLLDLEPDLHLAPEQNYEYVKNIAFRGPQSLRVRREAPTQPEF